MALFGNVKNNKILGFIDKHTKWAINLSWDFFHIQMVGLIQLIPAILLLDKFGNFDE